MRLLDHPNIMKKRIPILAVKLHMYQLCRSLAYTHALGVCHRDVKPQNLLVDPSNHVCFIFFQIRFFFSYEIL
eukprot:GSMAST32.ASY1.ANO1.1217.1 assembled CDS